MKRNVYNLCGRHHKGFSLIELMVSITLFTVVITASVGTLLALVSANQKAQSLKSVINNLNFSVESMSRTIRTGSTYYCVDTIPFGQLPATALDCATGAQSLVLTDDRGNRLAYRHSGTTIERRDINSGLRWIALSAPEIVIDEMRFYVTGTAVVGDSVQPTVTIGIRGHSGLKAATDSDFNIQTTVTQRVLDE